MCGKCHGKISAADARKQVSEYTQPDGSTKYFNLAGAPLSAATGKLRKVYHYKCYYVMSKEARIGARHFTDSPTIYEAAATHKNKDDFSEVALTRVQIAEARLAELNEQAEKFEEVWGTQDLDVTALIEEATADLALARRQEEIAEEKAKEDVPEDWNDWRNPASIDV